MRLIVLCSALCVASPTYAVSPEYSPEATPLAGAASTPTATPLSSADPVVSPIPAASSEYPLSRLEEIAPEPNENSLSNASGQDGRKLTKTELCSAAASVAAANNLPIPFFANLIQQESGFKSHVVSPAGAQGIAQFMPRVAASYGLENPFEPLSALKASARLLTDLLGQFGNLGLAAAAYNAGPKRVQDWMAKRRKLPAETRQYVHSITGRPAEQWASRGKDTEARLPPHARCPDLPAMAAPANEAFKPANQIAQIESSPRPRAPLGADSSRGGTHKIRLASVQHSMPQPSQFAIGLPVSRFAAMAKPVGVVDKKEGTQPLGQARSKARRPTLVSRFAAMPMPVIMVEEKAPRPPKASERLTARLKSVTPQVKAGTKAQRIRVAAAR
jgi:hypothetical protein